jgi:dsRNA-specific ribonuclease
MAANDMTLPALAVPALPKIEDALLSELALTHRSYLITRGTHPNGFLEDYEKLAMLGEQALR